MLRSGVLKSPVELTSCSEKQTLRASHASDVIMSVDGHHMGGDPESSRSTSSSPASSQVTSSGSAACDVALSFAEGDRKAAVILKQLLLEKAPSLKISEPMTGDFSRVQSLDVARVIVPLLSPAFLASRELVEELNIAIFRNRSSSRRILFPVQVAALPPKPSYVHLIPCEFSNSDYKWACEIVDRNLQDEASRIAESKVMDVDEAFCLKTAASMISQRLLEEGKPDVNLANRVLLNVHEIEEDWEQVKNALCREEGLVTWKRTFGIEIISQEGDLKPELIIQRDETGPASGDQTESKGVELHLEDIRNNEQDLAVDADNQVNSLKGVRFQEDSSKEQETTVSTSDSASDQAPHRSNESKSCSML